MTTASQYAKALYELISKNPSKHKEYAKNIQGVLQERGHSKLLPQILSELERLDEKNKRSERFNTQTPEQQKNRALLELYQKLVSSQ